MAQSDHKTWRWTHKVALHCSMLSFCISFAAVMGYVLQISGMTQWGSIGPAMAVNTAIALMLLSTGVLLMALRK